FRAELERRFGRRLLSQGRDVRSNRSADHLGVSRQRDTSLCSVGLSVPVGRITSAQLAETARLAEIYGSHDVRITTGQNLIIPNVSDSNLSALLREPLLPH